VRDVELMDFAKAKRKLLRFFGVDACLIATEALYLLPRNTRVTESMGVVLNRPGFAIPVNQSFSGGKAKTDENGTAFCGRSESDELAN
jgi:hypothetical protein